jgi:hypothetical protein
MSDLNAPHGIRRCLLIATAGLTFAGCDNAAVERELVGTWQAAVASATGAVQLRFTTLSNGQYRIEQVGIGALPPETGYFSAADGEWRKENIAGGIERGTYEFLSDDSVLFQTTAAGAVVWTRVADPMATSAVAAAAPLSTSPPLPPPAASAASDARSATQDILAAGPFGSPLATSSGFAQPSGMPATAAPFGAPTGAPLENGALPTTTFNPPTAGGTPLFAPPPEIVTAPSASAASSSSGAIPVQAAQNAISAGTRAVTNLDSGALADVSQQAITDLEASARETAAGIVDEAAADAAEEAERKVGERIRNFFRRDKQRNDQGQ